jgi:aminomethyltransferase
MSGDELRTTPFHAQHVALGAKMVPFAGYAMPVQYAGITKEHEAVRTAVGVFDVSHMGEFEFTGPDRHTWVNRLTCNDVEALDEGQAQYTALLNDRGTFIDDCIVYRFADRIMMVVNAANLAKDWEHVTASKGSIDADVADTSNAVALLAVQGPETQALLQPLTDLDLDGIGYYRFTQGRVAGTDCVVARTGYTGEDGFELYFGTADSAAMWDAIVNAGAVPCGLGARDTLRLEMGYALYGNDIDDTVNPYEARLGWIVKLQKHGGFMGQAALEAIKAEGPTRRLVGFRCVERAIPRQGYEVFLEGRQVDVVRSGGFSPSLQVGIGTTFLPAGTTAPGTEIELGVRGKRVRAEVVKTPFYVGGSVRKA